MKARFFPYFAASLTVAFVLALVWVLERSEQQRFQQQKRADVLNQLSAVRARLEGSVNQKLFLTQGLLAYVSAINPNLNQQEFESLARVIVAKQRNIAGISLYKNNVITHLYPLKGNEKAIGFNPMKFPEEREAFQKAIETRKTIVAGPVISVATGLPSFISRTPVFLTSKGAAPESGRYWGMVAVGFDLNPLLQEAGVLDPNTKLQYAIRGKDGLGAAGKVFFGDAKIFQQQPIALEVTLPNGSWQIAAVPIQGWPHSGPISQWLWMGGGWLALLAGGLVFILVSAPARLQQAVQRATVALRKSEDALLQANEELEMRVEQRTAELARANSEILALNDRLKSENLRMSAELDVTRRLQQMLLPRERELSQISGLEIAGFMEPAEEVGGDYYDVLQHNGGVKIGIGDVTGHGLESSVLMIMVQTAVRTLLTNNKTDPTEFLSAVNRTIYDNVQRMNSDKNLTLSLLDYHQGQLRLSGQHEEIIVVRADGFLERIDTIDLGFPIGLEADIADFVAQTQVQLQPGDVVVLYTDGITEAENLAGVHYGIERLCEVVRLNRQYSAPAIKQAVIDDVRSHIGTQKVYDDITLLVLKQK